MARHSGEFISLTVRPRSSRSRVERGPDGAPLVCVHSPAAEHAANREFVGVIAEALGLPRSAVRIVKGHRSRSKQIAVAGLSAAEARARLDRAAQGNRP